LRPSPQQGSPPGLTEEKMWFASGISDFATLVPKSY